MKIALKNVAIGSLVFALFLAGTPTALMATGEPPATEQVTVNGPGEALRLLAKAGCGAIPLGGIKGYLIRKYVCPRL